MSHSIARLVGAIDSTLEVEQAAEFPVWGQRADLDADETACLSAELRAGRSVDDREFDRIYDGRWREPSDVHWTRLGIASRIVSLLKMQQGEVLLDVGSGAGKFCLIGALTSPGDFVGVERRRNLVDVARAAQRKLRATRVQFLCGDALDVDWNPFDCIYLFNPFEEHLMEATSRVDNSVSFSKDDHARYVAETRKKLEGVPPGTRIAIYYGFGAPVPDSFSLMHSEVHDLGQLNIWRQYES